MDETALSIRQLRALSATVRLGSVSAAARALFVTPPAISAQLKTLESLIGAPVLRWSGNVPVPTEVGTAVLEAAARVEAAMHRCAEQVNALRSGAMGVVWLGVISTSKYFVPRLVAGFMRAHPQLTVRMKVGNRQAIVEALANGSVDLAIMGRPPQGMQLDKDVLFDHPHVLIAAPEHRLAQEAEIASTALHAEQFIVREPGSGTRMLMERFLDRVGDGRSFRQIELESNESIKQAVMANLGIALISAHTVAAELAAGRLASLRMPDLPILRKWYVLRPNDVPLSAAAELLRSYLVGHAADMAAELWPEGSDLTGRDSVNIAGPKAHTKP